VSESSNIKKRGRGGFWKVGAKAEALKGGTGAETKRGKHSRSEGEGHTYPHSLQGEGGGFKLVSDVQKRRGEADPEHGTGSLGHRSQRKRGRTPLLLGETRGKRKLRCFVPWAKLPLAVNEDF